VPVPSLVGQTRASSADEYGRSRLARQYAGIPTLDLPPWVEGHESSTQGVDSKLGSSLLIALRDAHRNDPSGELALAREGGVLSGAHTSKATQNCGPVESRKVMKVPPVVLVDRLSAECGRRRQSRCSPPDGFGTAGCSASWSRRRWPSMRSSPTPPRPRRVRSAGEPITTSTLERDTSCCRSSGRRSSKPDSNGA
jgi:hypothetical protein